MKERFFDIHHHLLWGMDDGPTQEEETLQMMEAAVEDGIGYLVATPHVVPGQAPFPWAEYKAQVDALNAYCKEKQWPLQLLYGAEILYTPMTAQALRQGDIPTLGGTQLVLVEFLPKVAYQDMLVAARTLLRDGLIPVFAHVERYEVFIKSPKRAMELKRKLGIFYQMNASSVISPKGFWRRRFCKKMLSMEEIDFVATDAHDSKQRKTCMTQAYQRLQESYGEAYAQEITTRNIFSPDALNE